MENEENILELIDIYMQLVEKQDEIIWRLSKMVSKQATEIQHLKNIHHFLDADLGEPEQDIDMKIVNEVLEEYKDMVAQN